MKLTPKDTVGLLLIAGTLGTLYVHIGPDGHASKHPSLVADGGGSVTTAVQGSGRRMVRARRVWTAAASRKAQKLAHSTNSSSWTETWKTVSLTR